MKTIEQIKEENALLIAKNYLHICKGVSLKELTNELIAYAIQQYDIKTTLSNVLLALFKNNCKIKVSREDYDDFLYFFNGSDFIFKVDLKKETLEEQLEETQISINKLLNEKC